VLAEFSSPANAEGSAGKRKLTIPLRYSSRHPGSGLSRRDQEVRCCSRVAIPVGSG
jgi:hypothetical protein